MDDAKQNYEQMLIHILEPLKKHFSPGMARVELGAQTAGYGNRIAGMEAFSRMLWGLVPYWAGGGSDRTLLPYMLEGIRNGTNPSHEEYWGDLHDKDQRMVEMAAIANGLLCIPQLLWEPLSEQEKGNLAAWLYQINPHTQALNNWQFFTVLVNLALQKLGRPYSRERMEEAMENYESYYIGNGWYGDGKRPQKDYYVSFAIHYYCLLYAYYAPEDAERGERYRERAMRFAQDFIYWFDEEGKAVPFGRSLTYRFAQAAFFSACAMTGVEVFPAGVLKGIIGRHLRFWMDQPIFDNGGVLTVGYAYPDLMMSEGYNAAGSPYWALKAFAFLAQPGESAFWAAKEEPLPPRARFKALPEADMLLHSRGREVVAYPAGQHSTVPYAHDAEKYEKFAYSSRFAFSVPRSYVRLEEAAPDSMLAFEVNGMIYVRRHREGFQGQSRIAENGVWAVWSPLEGIVVETEIFPTPEGHVRNHTIKCKVPCKIYDCGFAYPFCQEETLLELGEREAVVRDGNGCSRIYRTQRGLVPLPARGNLKNGLPGTPIIIAAAPNTNLMFPLTRIPAIAYEITEAQLAGEKGCAGEACLEIGSLIETEFTDKPIQIGGGQCYALCTE